MTTNDIRALTVVFGLAAAACSSGAGEDVATGSARATAVERAGADIDVHDCRVFVEKAGVDFGGRAGNSVIAYLKTHDGFDSAIASFKLHGIKHYADSEGAHEEVVAYDVKPVLGAGDFWQIQVYVTGDPDVGIGDTFQHGVFGVTTVKGTHYWLRAGDGADYLFNPELFGNLARVAREQGVAATGGPPRGNGRSPSALDAIFTADAFPYLNPRRCP